MIQLLRIIDPLRLLGWWRKVLFKFQGVAGAGLRTTYRAECFIHGGGHLSIGDHFLLDGTLEVYEHGQLRIGHHSFVGRSRIYAAHSISIGNYVLISDQCAVMDSDLHPLKASLRREVANRFSMGQFPDVYSQTSGAPVEIGDHVWVGFGVVILKGVRIGQGAILAAGSVITKDIPAWSVAAGNPARVIRTLGEHER